MMKYNKIYISGKITGLDLKEAKNNFKEAEIYLKECSSYKKIINPLEIVKITLYKSYNDYLIEDITILLDCDAIFMLKNWGNSKGARIERAIAMELGLKIYYQE